MIQTSINEKKSVSLTVERPAAARGNKVLNNQSKAPILPEVVLPNLDPIFPPDVVEIMQANANFFLNKHRLPSAIQRPNSSSSSVSDVTSECEPNFVKNIFNNFSFSARENC